MKFSSTDPKLLEENPDLNKLHEETIAREVEAAKLLIDAEEAGVYAAKKREEFNALKAKYKQAKDREKKVKQILDLIN